MITRLQNCVGITLFKWGRRQVELWFLPKGERVPMHAHDYVDSQIIMLAGRALFTLGNKTKELKARNIRKAYQVPAGYPHAVDVTGKFALFLNVEHWKTVPTSAAHDFRRI